MSNRYRISWVFVAVLVGCNSSSGTAPVADSPSVSGSTESVDDQAGGRQQRPNPNTKIAGTPVTEAEARQQLSALRSQLDDSLDELRVQVAAAEDDEQKQQIFRENNPVPGFVEQSMNLARAAVDTEIGVEAALAALAYAEGSQKIDAMNFLVDECCERLDHARIVQSLLTEIPGPHVESWLAKLVQAAPPGIAQAKSIMGMKTYYDQIPEFRATLQANPQVAGRLPESQLAYINAELSATQIATIEGHLQTVIDQYADLTFDGQRLGSAGTFGEVAEQELYELLHLGVGKTAPDIVGKDLDGAPFKLSDYRGKIVMLDFWGHWCPPCRRMYPHERHIVRELSGLPFALIGVNSDRKLETAQDSVRDDKLPWRNFWNGPEGTAGPISKQWSVSQWPTVYLIDGQGVIRYKGVQGENLNRGIEELMGEQGYVVDLSHGPLPGN